MADSSSDGASTTLCNSTAGHVRLKHVLPPRLAYRERSSQDPELMDYTPPGLCRCNACFAGKPHLPIDGYDEAMIERALDRAGFPAPVRLRVVTPGPGHIPMRPEPERPERRKPAFGFDKRQPWDPRPARRAA